MNLRDYKVEVTHDDETLETLFLVRYKRRFGMLFLGWVTILDWQGDDELVVLAIKEHAKERGVYEEHEEV